MMPFQIVGFELTRHQNHLPQPPPEPRFLISAGLVSGPSTFISAKLTPSGGHTLKTTVSRR